MAGAAGAVGDGIEGIAAADFICGGAADGAVAGRSGAVARGAAVADALVTGTRVVVRGVTPPVATRRAGVEAGWEMASSLIEPRLSATCSTMCRQPPSSSPPATTRPNPKVALSVVIPNPTIATARTRRFRRTEQRFGGAGRGQGPDQLGITPELPTKSTGPAAQRSRNMRYSPGTRTGFSEGARPSWRRASLRKASIGFNLPST